MKILKWKNPALKIFMTIIHVEKTILKAHEIYKYISDHSRDISNLLKK